MSVVTSGPVPGVVRQDVRAAPPGVLLTGVPALLGRVGAAGAQVEDATVDRTIEADLDADCYVAYRVTSWAQFLTLDERIKGRFGSAPGSHLADAVRGFFGNGGQVAYVLWVASADDALVALRRGLAALDAIAEVDLVAVPDLFGPAVWPPLAGGQGTGGQDLEGGAGIGGSELASVVACQRAVLDHCAARGDRFAVLDGVPSVEVGEVIAQRAGLAGPSAAYGALYFPWVQLDLPGTAARFVPASGHLAGLYAGVDAEIGVHRAPANVVVDGVLDVQVAVSDGELRGLAAGGVNALLALPGRGIRVWGVRTVSDDPAWRTVPVRRVVGTFRRWLETFMVTLTHEPNDIRLWVRIMREVSAHLEGLYLRGVLRGVVPEEAFYVKCDHETNPPSVVDAGIVVTEVGLAPAVPAEFIVVRAVQGADGVMVSAG